MFDMNVSSERVDLAGRLDATQVDHVREEMSAVQSSTIVDFERLDYISSAGLGVLLGVQKRLSEKGQGLKLVNLNRHIREIFRITGFDHVFEIE